MVFQGLNKLHAFLGDNGRHLRITMVVTHGHSVRLLEKIRQVSGDEGTGAWELEGLGLGAGFRFCRPLRLEQRQHFAPVGDFLEILERDDLGHILLLRNKRALLYLLLKRRSWARMKNERFMKTVPENSR